VSAVGRYRLFDTPPFEAQSVGGRRLQGADGRVNQLDVYNDNNGLNPTAADRPVGRAG
jgi:hypothetical protein